MTTNEQNREPGPRGGGPLSGFAVYPSPEAAAAEPPAQKPGSDPEPEGPLSGFAVYASPEGESSDDGDPDDGGQAAAEERYIEPEDVPVGHSIRLRPGSSLSIGHRSVYRTDRRGVPHFAAGWTPAAARSHYRRLHLGAAALAVASAAACVLMSLAGVGSDSAYTDLAADGTRTTALVTSVQRTTTAGEGLQPSYRTVEETRFSYDADGARTGSYQTESTDRMPPLAKDTRWQEGEEADILVDAKNPETFLPVDPDQPSRINALTLLPLLPMGLFTAASAVAGRKMHVMGNLAKAA